MPRYRIHSTQRVDVDWETDIEAASEREALQLFRLGYSDAWKNDEYTNLRGVTRRRVVVVEVIDDGSIEWE